MAWKPIKIGPMDVPPEAIIVSGLAPIGIDFIISRLRGDDWDTTKGIVRNTILFFIPNVIGGTFFFLIASGEIKKLFDQTEIEKLKASRIGGEIIVRPG